MYHTSAAGATYTGMDEPLLVKVLRTNAKSNEKTLLAKYAQFCNCYIETYKDVESELELVFSTKVNDDELEHMVLNTWRSLDQRISYSSGWYFIHNGIIRYRIEHS